MTDIPELKDVPAPLLRFYRLIEIRHVGTEGEYMELACGHVELQPAKQELHEYAFCSECARKAGAL